MEASALCNTIFAYVGQGQGPPTADKLIVRTKNPAVIEGGAGGVSEEPTGETAPEPFSIGQASGDPINTGSSSSTGQDMQQVEKEGVVLTFVGNKASDGCCWACERIRIFMPIHLKVCDTAGV